MGGLFAAHLLRAHGWDVAVFERSGGALADRGASIGTRAELFEILRSIGIALDPSAGVAVTARICLDRNGTIAGELPVHSVNSAWDRIYRPLRDALPDELYRASTRVERVEQDANSVTALLADGTRETGTLLIAADGIHSSIRAQLAPEVTPRYAGYVAWRGVIEESEMTAAEHALLFGRMCFSLPEGELLLALGMPGRDADMRPGHRRYYWIWFRPADEAHGLPALCTDANGRCHGSSIPPHLVRAEVIRDLQHAAEANFAPPLTAIIRRTRQPYPHGIFDVEAPRLTFGRVVLLGDSAFRRATACRCWHHQGGARCQGPGRGAGGRARSRHGAGTLRPRAPRFRQRTGGASTSPRRLSRSGSEAARRRRAAAGNRAAGIRHGRED